MKSFLIGASGAIFILLIYLAIPQMSDYTQRAISTDMLVSIQPSQKEIDKLLLSKSTIAPKEVANFTKRIALLKIQDNGTIIIKATEHGQVLVLSPSINGTNVIWHCYGGPNKYVPPSCRT